MLSDGLQLLGASKATNFSIESAGTLPASGNTGELFYLTGAGAGLRIYNGTNWVAVSGFSGDYNDLTNKPTLATVATTGEYADLLNEPALATIATTGSYTDLINVPADLTSIAGLLGTTGFLKKTAASTFTLDTTAYLPSTGPGTYTGNLTMAGDILPDANLTRNLGSATLMWKDIFVGPGSIYMNGKKILEEVSSTIVFSTDVDQNVRIETSGTGNLELQAATTGAILIKGTMTITSGRRILDSAGTQIEFGDNIEMGTNKITGLGAPTAANDATTKTYVDTLTTNDATIVRTTGNQSIGGVKTFTGTDVVINGNLTVSGTTTTVNSETVNIADNILELNSNFTAGTPTEDSGLQIRRGDEGIVRFIWDEVNDRFTMRDGATTPNYLSLYTTANITAGTFTGALTGNVTGNASTASTWQTARTLSFTGDATGSMSVDGSANASAALTLATVNNDDGTFGSATAIPIITVNDKGLITAVSTAAAAVTSVAGRTGAITLTTTDVTEGTNLYYTDARVRTAISLSAGTSGATYTSGTGVFDLSALTINAGALTGNTLAAGVTASSLTSVGTLAGLNINDKLSVLKSDIGIEIDSNGTSTAYVDFHSGSTFIDYDARIYSSGGTGTVGAGDLYLYGGTIIFGTGGGNPERVRIDSNGNVQLTNDLRWGTFSAGSGGQLISSTTTALGTLSFYTAGNERLRIDSSGNVGINGAAGATIKLDVNGVGRVTELLLTNGASTGQLGTTPGWYSPASGVAALSTNGAERLRIDSNGSVKIGTTTSGLPADRFIVGSGSGDQGITIFPGTGGIGSIHFTDTTAEKASIKFAAVDGALRFNTTSNERMRIDNNGNVGINAGTSLDSNFKLSVGGRLALTGSDTIVGTDKPFLFRLSAGGLGISANNEGAGSQPITFYTTGVERLRIGADGRIQTQNIHNNAGGASGGQYLASGTYTPTLTSVTNVASASMNGTAQWIRVGNVVTVSGAVNFSASSSGTPLQLDLSLPIASSLSSHTCAGSAVQDDINHTSHYRIKGNGTANRASISTFSAINSSTNYSFHFTYLVQ